MAIKRAFISFDFDHDEDLRNLLAGQAKSKDTPFEFSNWSVKAPMTGDWKAKVVARIKAADLMIVICGEHTESATGVSAELRIAKDEDIPYFLLWGRKSAVVTKPKAAGPSDKVYNWTWENLKTLVNGGR